MILTILIEATVLEGPRAPPKHQSPKNQDFLNHLRLDSEPRARIHMFLWSVRPAMRPQPTLRTVRAIFRLYKGKSMEAPTNIQDSRAQLRMDS